MKSFVAGHFMFPKALSFAIEAEERRQHVQSVTVSCCTKNVLQSCTAAKQMSERFKRASVSMLEGRGLQAEVEAAFGGSYDDG